MFWWIGTLSGEAILPFSFCLPSVMGAFSLIGGILSFHSLLKLGQLIRQRICYCRSKFISLRVGPFQGGFCHLRKQKGTHCFGLLCKNGRKKGVDTHTSYIYKAWTMSDWTTHVLARVHRTYQMILIRLRECMLFVWTCRDSLYAGGEGGALLFIFKKLLKDTV